ncbi:uncharacterized protein si:dkey-237j10.2 [Trichomycterus rosablanca]|uniref:uncharacterized protein si:dkey-237j10.2 n=1 Tax=Trichomycterus rosablanca TaxID=2290929 RepID=UPI002F35CAA3
MLGEGFLHVLNYTEGHTPLSTQKTQSHTEFNVTPHRTVRSPQTPRAQQVKHFEGLEKPRPRLTSVPSVALAIPSCSAEDHWSVDLYESGYFPSLYQAYPDLQLAGGTLAPRFSLNPNHFTPQDGPLLISQDLGSLEALEEPEEQANVPNEADEGYLVIESVKSPGREPRLTNSMLNGFLETQLMEVYRQHMQDNLARCSLSSITANVVPHICAKLSASDRNADSWGEGLNSTTTQSSVRYLSTCSAPTTSNFSSPVLRISTAQEQDL